VVIVALLWDGEEVKVKRLYGEEEDHVRLGPENVRIQGRKVYVVHPLLGRAAGGGA
jgi:hypothetical protein